MRSEADVLPYAPGELAGEPLLVLAPHPDDEVFGCGAVLAQAAAAGRAVHVVVLTDGGAQGDPETRREESREAARRLGIGPPEFWGLADRSLEPLSEELARLLRNVLLARRPAVLAAPSPVETHPDHRALSLALHRLLRSDDSVAQALPALCVASYEVSNLLHPNLLVDATSVWPTVRRAAEAFGSQTEMLPYLEVLEGVATARRLTLGPAVQRAEAYHVVELQWLRQHPVERWVACHGAMEGLERDLETPSVWERIVGLEERIAELERAAASIGLLGRLLGRPRRDVTDDPG